ncbi:hypothetical protein HDE_10344 [Halotydeus destructor]|nr:hypothetical protein HDE_10344 [Halotydeus destructor]
MTLSSLNDLHDHILNRVFYFAPSVLQLLHIKETNPRFNKLTKEYFKILKVFDFRSPLKVDEYFQFETKWCSDDSVKIITETWSDIAYKPILPKFEGEFLEKLRSEYDAKLSQGLDPGDIQALEEFYRSLHTKTKTWSDSYNTIQTDSYKVSKRQRKLTHDLTTLSYLYRYLVSLPDYAHFIQDYKAVEHLTVSSIYASSWFDDIKNIVTLFSGLKYLVLGNRRLQTSFRSY